MQNIEEAEQRLTSLSHNSKEEIEADLNFLTMHKMAYEEILEKVSSRPKPKRVILDEIEEQIIRIEEAINLGQEKLISLRESAISTRDIN